MKRYSLTHLADQTLLRELAALVSRDRATTAALLAHLAEVDARQLYLSAAYPSMHAYCVHAFGMSEDAAYKRIQAARVARRFPVIFEAAADGRLHLSAVGLLAPHLTPENAEELLAAAAHRTKSEIEALLAQRFPRSETLALAETLQTWPPEASEFAPGKVDSLPPERVEASHRRLAPAQVAGVSKLAPVAPQRFLLQLTIGSSTQDKLSYAKDLLGHTLPSGDLAQVIDRALDALIGQLERRKFGATKKPRRCQRPSATLGRYVPAHVKRAVWERDGGRCTFVSETGRRCRARKFLEFDHVDEVARGGRASIEGIRLLCRAHNQNGAERTFGVEFMRRKRQQAREAAARAQARAKEKAAEVIPWLRALGIRLDEARRAAAKCEAIPEAPLEERMRLALTCFGPRTPSCGRVAPASAACGT